MMQQVYLWLLTGLVITSIGALLGVFAYGLLRQYQIWPTGTDWLQRRWTKMAVFGGTGLGSVGSLLAASSWGLKGFLVGGGGAATTGGIAILAYVYIHDRAEAYDLLAIGVIGLFMVVIGAVLLISGLIWG